MEKTVNGVFLQLGISKDTFENRSKRWWTAIISLTAFALLLVFVLVAIAATSNSQMGIPVVSGTFVIAIVIFITDVIMKNRIEGGFFANRREFLKFALIILIISTVVFPISFLALPSNWYDLWYVVVAGGLVLSIILLLIYEGYPKLRERGSPGIITISGLLIVFGMIYMTVIAYWIVPYDPFTINVGGIREPPNPDFPLGTTSLGQDLMSRVIAGGATMLQVAVLSVIICFSIGVPLGLIAAYRGGWLDRGVGLFMDSIFAFPGLVLAIAIAAMLGPGVANMAIAIAVVYIPSYFRVVRSQVLTIKELPYVEAAVVMGARDREILFRYILPNAFPSAVVIMSINFADAVLTAAALTFVGLGLPIDIADWGWDLTFGFRVLIVGAWWISLFPGIMIVLLALGFTMAGEGLNEILTPKLKE